MKINNRSAIIGFILIISVLGLLFISLPASIFSWGEINFVDSQLVNSDFEEGSLTGWSGSNTAQVTSYPYWWRVGNPAFGRTTVSGFYICQLTGPAYIETDQQLSYTVEEGAILTYHAIMYSGHTLEITITYKDPDTEVESLKEYLHVPSFPTIDIPEDYKRDWPPGTYDVTTSNKLAQEIALPLQVGKTITNVKFNNPNTNVNPLWIDSIYLGVYPSPSGGIVTTDDITEDTPQDTPMPLIVVPFILLSYRRKRRDREKE